MVNWGMQVLSKPITRKTRNDFMYYGAPIVVTLLPGDAISLRLHRHKAETIFCLHELYFDGIRRDVRKEKAAKAKAKRMK